MYCPRTAVSCRAGENKVWGVGGCWAMILRLRLFPLATPTQRGLIQPSLHVLCHGRSRPCNSLEVSTQSPFANIWKSLSMPPGPQVLPFLSESWGWQGSSGFLQSPRYRESCW